MTAPLDAHGSTRPPHDDARRTRARARTGAAGGRRALQRRADRARSVASRRLPEFPHPPPAYDASRLSRTQPDLGHAAGRASGHRRSLKGRLRGFVWRLSGRPLEAQRHFNATLVDHLNRNVAAHEEAEKAIATTIALVREQVEGSCAVPGAPDPVPADDHALRGHARPVCGGRRPRCSTRASARSPTSGSSAGSRSAPARRGWTAASHAVLASLADVRATAALAQQTAVSLKREVERRRGARRRRAPLPGGAAGARRRLRGVRSAGGRISTPSSISGSRTRFAARRRRFGAASRPTCRCLPVAVMCWTWAAAVASSSTCCAARGVPARGIDINAAMVEETRARGLAGRAGRRAGVPSGRSRPVRSAACSPRR